MVNKRKSEEHKHQVERDRETQEQLGANQGAAEGSKFQYTGPENDHRDEGEPPAQDADRGVAGKSPEERTNSTEPLTDADAQDQPIEEKANAKTKSGNKPAGSEPQPSGNDFPVVGIGASAGGLYSLEKFFEHLPDNLGMAFIVVQHLSPDRKSLMAKILSRKTAMQVRDITDGMKLEPNTIYAKPSDQDVVVTRRTLRLKKPEKEQALPVDRLFRSMAGDLGDKAVGVILSGTGSDGTLGVQEIKGAGGMVMVQDPEEAEYPGMPESANETGKVDHLLEIREMPEVLITYFRNSSHRQRQNIGGVEADEKDELNAILKVVHSRTGHDLTQYKKSTVKRRVARRMDVTGIDSMPDYERFLRMNPDEVDVLFKDLIINVTSFFRDPEALEALKEKAIVPLVASMEDDNAVRVWVPGCATGEEAYTLGMLFVEVMDEQKRRLKVKIFGSDINVDSIAAARDALYPGKIAEDVDTGRLKRFFAKVNGNYRVEKSLREMMVFSVHDITRDPPFSRVDLVSCRNLLIYMESELQNRILPLLRYALKPKGYLFLGASEGVGGFSELFHPIDRKWKVFQVEEQEFQRQFDFTYGPPTLGQEFREKNGPGLKGKKTKEHDHRKDRDARDEEIGPEQFPFQKTGDMRQVVEQTMLARFAPSGVIVDSDNVVRFFHGDTSSFLQPPRGEPRFDILDMARPGLRSILAKGLKEAGKEKRQITYENVGVWGDGDVLADVSFIPLAIRTVRRDMHLVTFMRKPKDAAGRKSEVEESSTDSRMRELEQELYSIKQDLQAIIEELETSNEELKSSNEELQATNEELQSANEELDTSQEELQSTNDELETVNTELQRKNEELESINDDIRNMFSHTSVGTVILDKDLRVKRFTQPVTGLFNLIEKDMGRELADIATKLEYDTLDQDAHQVLDTLKTKEKEVRSRDGRWFVMRMFPYRTGDNVVRGLVLNFTDVTDLKTKEQEAEEAKTRAEAILETTRQPLLVLDSDLKVTSANNAFYETFQVAEQQTEHRLLYELGEGQWDIPDLRTLLEEIIPKNTSFKDYQVEHDFPKVGRKKLLVDARRIDRSDGRPYLILVGFMEKNG
jgi:two-component system, chemotaxis family, CheB/CheR fusion protein